MRVYAPDAKILTSLTLVFLVMGIFPSCIPRASASIDVHLTAFSGGEGDVVIAFPAAGSNSSLNLSFQTGMRVVTAFLNVTGLPYTGGGTDCPDSPSIDLGADGDVEWRFNGTGYGALGDQYLFNDGNSTFKEVFPPGGGVSDSMLVRLPSNSDVIDASLALNPSGFSGSLNVSLDVGADNITDWNNRTVNGQVTISGLASLIGAYTATALPDGTDSYGVQYVDVPLRVRCGSAATLTFSGLNVRYNATLTSGNLANRLTALIPSALGSQNVTIPVKVESGSAGRLRIFDVRILARPPLHAPDLLDASPQAGSELSINENENVNFSIRPVDAYNDQFTVQWSLDLAPVAGANGTAFSYLSNFSSSGRHSVTVTATNDQSESSLTWWVNVRDVDRPPVVDSYYPGSQATVDEGFSLVFLVNASDPDGDQLAELWTLDGHQQVSGGPSFAYAPPMGAAGYHSVSVTVSDPGGKAVTVPWTVLVRKTNLPPVIQSSDPAANITIKEGETQSFSVNASDPNGDPLIIEWFLDGSHVGFGPSYNYSPDYQSFGQRTLLAIVSDGQFNVQRAWNVTVADVDRAPHAVIDSPREGDEYLDTDILTLNARNSTDPDKDPLTFQWFDGESLLASGETTNVSLSRGPHTIRLTVNDGKGGSDGSSVNITVRTFLLTTNMTISSRNPKEGDMLRIKIFVSNDGDMAIRDIRVDFYADGVAQGNVTVPRILPGNNVTEFFFWKVQSGRHDMIVTIGNDTRTAYVTVPPEMPVVIYWIVAPLVVSLGVVAVLSVYFSVQWNKAIQKGIIDERKRRGIRELETKKAVEPERLFGAAIHNIRLAFAPYKEKPFVIKTTIPQQPSQHDSIQESLTPVKKRYMAHFTSSRSTSGHITQVGGAAPVTAGIFPGRRAPSTPKPAGRETEMPQAPPAKDRTGPKPVDAPAPVAGEPGAAPAKVADGAEEPRPAADAAAPRRPKKRMKDLEDRLQVLDTKGADVTGPRRMVSLARSFLKGGNSNKAEQYLDKAESKTVELEKEASTQQSPACPKCGASVDPAWIMCPECESKLK